MTTYVYVTQEYEVKDVIDHLREYNFPSEISLEAFIEIFETLDPNKYHQLLRPCIAENVLEEIPDDIIKVLVTSPKITYNMVISRLKLEPKTIQYIIDNKLDQIEVDFILKYQKISTEQIKQVLYSGYDIDHYELGNIIGERQDIETSLWIINNWNELQSLNGSIPDSFRTGLFEKFGSLIISDNDCKEIFGFERPSFSTEDLRGHKPCIDGWKRAIKWAGRNDKKYTWNEFIARHILNNQDDINDAQGDLNWLASCITDEPDYSNYFLDR